MNCFISTNTNAFYNLALEEFLLKEKSENFFFLWRSKPVVVIGKHQNPYKEIDINYAFENDIKIARRLSGGGTVYQDLENLNFSFVINTEEGKQINPKQHSKPIFEALKELGLNVKYSNRNDLLINGKKISGNAEHVYKNRVLHHGTLLYNSNLEQLEKVLRNRDKQYNDKSIASVRSEVTNIKSSLKENIDIQEFQKKILDLILRQSVGNKKTDELNSTFVRELTQSKYHTTEWIFSYTPKYEMKNRFVFGGKECQFYLYVEKGEILDINIEGLPKELVSVLKNNLLKQKHLYSNLRRIFQEFPLEYKNLYKRLF